MEKAGSRTSVSCYPDFSVIDGTAACWQTNPFLQRFTTAGICSYFHSRHGILLKSCKNSLGALQLITKRDSLMFVMIKQSIKSFELILPKTFAELLPSRSCHGLEAFKSPFCFCSRLFHCQSLVLYSWVCLWSSKRKSHTAPQS